MGPHLHQVVAPTAQDAHVGVRGRHAAVLRQRQVHAAIAAQRRRPGRARPVGALRALQKRRRRAGRARRRKRRAALHVLKVVYQASAAHLCPSAGCCCLGCLAERHGH